MVAGELELVKMKDVGDGVVQELQSSWVTTTDVQ